MAKRTEIKGDLAKCVIVHNGIEWVVMVYVREHGFDYARHEPSDYFTDDWDDAWNTACHIAGLTD